jgi:hypothetical protein
MSHTRIAIVAAMAALGNISSEASARGRLFPLTRCGPNLAYLCRIHGYFDNGTLPLRPRHLWSGGKETGRCWHRIEGRCRALPACAPVHTRIGRRRLGRRVIDRPIVDRALVDTSSPIRAGITDKIAEGVPAV